MTSGYWELSLASAADVSEALTNFLWELGALGVVEEECAGEPARLRGFFAAASAPAAVEEKVRDYVGGLRALGFLGAGEPAVAAVADENWAEAWRRYFRPLPVGRTLLVAPPWEPATVEGRRTILIEPARAFGTGHHGTTAGCLTRLEAICERRVPAAALDIGTGSGILAVTAALLGVAAVLAVDDDPDAVAAASGNAARNGVADRVRCLAGDAGDLAAPPVPLVLANLLTAAHLRLAGRYPRHVARGGTLVLGGLLDTEAVEVTGALARNGFRALDATSIDGWTTLELRREADAPVHDRA